MDGLSLEDQPGRNISLMLPVRAPSARTHTTTVKGNVRAGKPTGANIEPIVPVATVDNTIDSRVSSIERRSVHRASQHNKIHG